MHSRAGSDGAAALEHLRRALEADRPAAPSERARTLLAMGNVLRRCGRVGDARGVLERARSLFEQRGESVLAGRCRQELRLLRRPVPDPGLTAAERRVAEQVVTGVTNREVAARLQVSQRAVEMHLTSVYGKLGVRGRTELAMRASTCGLEAGSEDVGPA